MLIILDYRAIVSNNPVIKLPDFSRMKLPGWTMPKLPGLSRLQLSGIRMEGTKRLTIFENVEDISLFKDLGQYWETCWNTSIFPNICDNFGDNVEISASSTTTATVSRKCWKTYYCCLVLFTIGRDDTPHLHRREKYSLHTKNDYLC